MEQSRFGVRQCGIGSIYDKFLHGFRFSTGAFRGIFLTMPHSILNHEIRIESGVGFVRVLWKAITTSTKTRTLCHEVFGPWHLPVVFCLSKPCVYFMMKLTTGSILWLRFPMWWIVVVRLLLDHLTMIVHCDMSRKSSTHGENSSSKTDLYKLIIIY